VLLHSDASLFGLAVGQLVFAGTTSVLQHSGILQLFYAANIMIAMWVAVVDLVDLRPMGVRICLYIYLYAHNSCTPIPIPYMHLNSYTYILILHTG